MTTTAFKEGWDAYISKEGLYNNPYDSNTKEYWDYDNGWCEADYADELEFLHNSSSEFVYLAND